MNKELAVKKTQEEVNREMIYFLSPLSFYPLVWLLQFLDLLFIYHSCLHDRSKQEKLLFLIVNSLERTILVNTEKQEKSIKQTERKLIVQISITVGSQCYLIYSLSLLHLHLTGSCVNAVWYLSFYCYQYLASEYNSISNIFK